MCTNKVFVGDMINGYRRRSRGNYFACGRCPSCQQQKANRRAARIRNHHPKGLVAYFVTLSYHNDYIPYVSKSDLLDFYAVFRDTDTNCGIVPIYRDYDFKAKFKKPEKTALEKPIDKMLITKNDLITLKEMQKLRGLATVVSRHPTRRTFDPDKISICYIPDIQNFIKRLRQNYFREYSERLNLSYYSAPEYGPTFGRFHVHLILWLPSSLTESTVFQLCRKAWPYENLYNKTFCEVARNPGHYVASYVNCSSDVSLALQKWFPLRSSHSLEFGFDFESFSLSWILGDSLETRRFKYTYLRKRPDGVYVETSAFIPSYVLYRYFPKIKGFRNIPRATLLHVLRNPWLFMPIQSKKLGRESNGDDLFLTCTHYFGGQNMLLSIQYFNSFCKRLFKTYRRHYVPLGISWYDYIDIIVDYWIRRPLEMYKDSQLDDSPTLTTRRFFNLADVRDGKVHNITIARHIRGDIKEIYNPNTLPEEVDSTRSLTQQFNDNMKTRKLTEIS